MGRHVSQQEYSMGIQHQGLTDEELVTLAQQGSQEETAQLVSRYIPLVRGQAARYFGPGLEQEDLMQEGFIGLLKAIRAYDPSKGSSFRTFAALCVNRRMMSAVRSSHSDANTPLRDYRSISEEEMEPFGDVDPEQYLIGKEEGNALLSRILSQLSVFEQHALKLYLRGHSYREMSQILRVSPKSVDNAIQRIRRKLKKV